MWYLGIVYILRVKLACRIIVEHETFVIPNFIALVLLSNDLFSAKIVSLLGGELLYMIHFG